MSATPFFEAARNAHLASQLNADGSHIQQVATVNAGSTSGNSLAIPGTAHQLTAGSSSGNVQLTSTVTMISILANGANIRFAIGNSNAVTASATSAFCAQGERQDLAVPAGSWVAAIRDGSVSGVLEITELT